LKKGELKMAKLKAEIELENNFLKKEINFQKREIELLKEIIEREDKSTRTINNLIDDLEKMDDHIMTINNSLKVFNENSLKNVEFVSSNQLKTLELILEKFIEHLDDEKDELTLDEELKLDFEIDELDLDD
jgi:hypothetical protein